MQTKTITPKLRRKYCYITCIGSIITKSKSDKPKTRTKPHFSSIRKAHVH